MSLEVIEFTERKKVYKSDAGEFALKPPYIYIVSQAESLIKKINDVKDSAAIKEGDTDTEESSKITDSKEFKKVIDVYLKILKLLLEETGNGKLADLTADNLRLDIAERVVVDFFSQFRR
jgi:hypothetical protein